MKIYILYIFLEKDGQESYMHSFKTIEGAKKYSIDIDELMMRASAPEWVYYEPSNYWHTKDGRWQILEDELKE